MRRLHLALLLVAAVIGLGLPVSGASAQPSGPPLATGIGVRLVDVPVASTDDPRAQTYIVDHLRPGRTINRRVEVVNHTQAVARVSVYSAAASVGQGGFVGALAHTQNELSSWTSTSPTSLVLKTQEHAFVMVTIKVPALAVRGENYAVVWVQATTPATAAAGVTQVSRVGIRLYLSIGPGGAPPSDFTIASLTAARDNNRAPIVIAAIRNTGQRALDLKGTLNLSHGPGGLSAGPFPIPLGTTLGIGNTEPLQVKLNAQLPDGPWRATVTVTSGLTSRTAQATLTFPPQPGTGPAQNAHLPAAAYWPQIAVGTVAALAMLLALAALILRRKRRTDRTTTPDDD